MNSTLNSTLPNDVQQYLKSLPLFTSIAASWLEKFTAASIFQAYDSGESILLQGEKIDWVYVVLSGWVKLYRTTQDGNEAVIDILTGSQVFGETAMLTDDISPFNAVAIEQCTVIKIPVTLFHDAIKSDTKLAYAMLKSLSKFRDQQSREIESLTLQNASERIGCYLLRLCRVDVPEPVSLTLPFDKTHIAARLGMKAETFSRALKKLRQETDIKVEGRQVIVPTIDCLASFACKGCSNEYPCDDIITTV